MIISKTPIRISFAGGISDIRDYYKNDYGAVVSTTIDKYVYVTINKKFDDKIRVSYSKTEIVDKIEEINHPLVREALRMVDLDGGLEITSIADIPSGTGLGLSSAFTVGLLNALYAFKGEYKGPDELARQACKIEIDILGEPIGKQDQYIAAYGGLNYIKFNADEAVFVEPIIFDKKTKDELNDNLMMFYTGIQRKPGILSESKKEIEKHREYIDKIRDIADETATALRNNDLLSFGELLHKEWTYKKKTGEVSTPSIDKYYEKARSAGASGGKILGAGGGGFLLLYCKLLLGNDEGYQYNVREALKGLKQTRFNLEPQGSRIIYVE